MYACSVGNTSLFIIFSCVLDRIEIFLLKISGIEKESVLNTPLVPMEREFVFLPGCQIARVIAELASQSSGSDEELEGACGRVLHVTPSRFTRCNQCRTWNTGNGSPDAICFSVDRPGVAIVGESVAAPCNIPKLDCRLL